MKNLIAFILTLTLSAAALSMAMAQARATGHVSAEIVEVASIRSNTQNLVQIQQNQTAGNFELGEITLNGGSNAACNVLIHSSDLKGENGTQSVFTASPSNITCQPVLNNNGSQILRLTGSADHEILSNTDKWYVGNYQVVLAYN